MRFKGERKNRNEPAGKTGKRREISPAGSAPMKSWLDLIPLSEHVHRKRSRMTRICIVLAVALVMTIFGMADMEIRNQIRQARMSDGGWHASFREITPEQAALIAARPQVTAAGWYGIYNYDLDEHWCIDGVETSVVGIEEELIEMFPAAEILEGTFPGKENEAVFSENARERLGLSIGDQVTLDIPWGERVSLTVSGFCGQFSRLNRQDAFGVFLNMDSFYRIAEAAGEGEEAYRNSIYMVAFSPFCRIQKTLADIRQQLSLRQEQVSENIKMLGLIGQSSDSYMIRLMQTGIALAVLVMIFGVLMITGSLNSNIAQRTEFFGMLRCLGATRPQISRFVTREALGWCRTAVPAGLLIGTAVIWGLCAVLKLLSSLFAEMPLFSISWIGIAAGAVVGVLTVLLASRTPAKRAAAVSPLTAVSGNAGTPSPADTPGRRKAADTRHFSVEIALGIHHALGGGKGFPKSFQKGFFLLAGSYALSVILFLAFSVLPDMGKHAVNPLDPAAPDLSVISTDNTCSLSRRLSERLAEEEAVKRVYGRSFAYEIPALWEGIQGSVCLFSYEENQLQWAQDDLLVPSKKTGESMKASRFTKAAHFTKASQVMDAVRQGEGVLVVYGYEGQFNLAAGDVITLQLFGGTRDVTVLGVLSDTPCTTEGETQMICSEKLFSELTGIENYTVIDMQLKRNASDEDVQRIRTIVEETEGADAVTFSDRRMSNSEAVGAWYSLMLIVYGFLAVIALISLVHIINSTDMGVSARIREYGRMRAVGMTVDQLVKMVAAETLTCCFSGVLTGCAAGLPLNWLLYESLVTAQWGSAWHFPIIPLLVILTVTAISVLLAIYGPTQRIRAMSVTETIGAQ